MTIEAQHNAGITTQRVTPSSQTGTVNAVGLVIPFPDVSDLVSRSIVATMEVNRAKAAQTISQSQFRKVITNQTLAQQQVERFKILNADNKNISDKALEAAQGAYQSSQSDVVSAQSTVALDEANLRSAQLSLKAVQDAATQRVGPVLALWVIHNAPQFQQLLQRTSMLVQVTVPFEAALHKLPRQLVLHSADGQQYPAQFVSNALQADARVQGISGLYYVSAKGTSLIPGITLTTELPVSRHVSGIAVPSSAVVWWEGKPWVYVETTKNHFTRRLLQTYTTETNQWFVTQGLTVGETVVTTGSALLLSQEFQSTFAEGE
jgi:hypothetical protein